MDADTDSYSEKPVTLGNLVFKISYLVLLVILLHNTLPALAEDISMARKAVDYNVGVPSTILALWMQWPFALAFIVLNAIVFLKGGQNKWRVWVVLTVVGPASVLLVFFGLIAWLGIAFMLLR